MINKMINISKWTKEDLLALYKGRHEEGLDFNAIAEKIKKTAKSVSIQYKRVNWDAFLDNPDSYMQGKGDVKKWDDIEMAKLYAFIKGGKPYDFIAKELNRSFTSVERKAQTTNWQAWQTTVGSVSAPKSIEEEEKDSMKQKLSDALIQLCREDKGRLNEMDEKEFLRKINLDKDALKIPYSEIKKATSEHLDSLGYGNPEELVLGKGLYIIIGDSHGKHMKTEMFHLIKEIDRALNATNIIHVGHILDDDNDISYNMGIFKNLIVVAKTEELRIVQELRNIHNSSYQIVRDTVLLGDNLNITNQDLISDYVRSSLSTLDSHIFDERTIVNNHRLEWTQKCSEGGETSYIVSPGCVCERFVNRTIKQIDFEDGKTVKQACHEGFSKYRRMKQMYKYWDQGVLIVNVNEKGEHTIVPCLIRSPKKGEYITSYFDKIITNTGVKKPDQKIFISADMHSPNQDDNVLDIQTQICKDYKPDVFVNIGDSHDNRSLNHHEMEKGHVINEDVLDESAQVHHSLKKMANWAKEKYIIYGNHERFAADFVARFPQFKKYLDFQFICDIEALGYTQVSLKDVLKLGPTKFIHGDIGMWGQSGSKIEKAARTFKGTVFIGHMHYPAIRFGTYSIGLSGKLDQKYNEPNASTWIHGFGMCNHYHGFSFPTTIAISNNTCILNNKSYIPIDPKSWKIGKYIARIVYQ